MYITVMQTTPASSHKGRFEDIAQNHGSAGYVAHCGASGAVEVHGRTLKFTNGHAIHETIIQSRFLLDRLDYLAGRGLNWMHGFSKTVSSILIAGEGKRAGGMVNIGGRQLSLPDHKSATIEDTASWLDPKTKIMQPYQWRVSMRKAEGTLEAETFAYGRAYYTWIRRGGVLLVKQFVANTRATFTYPDGRVVTEDQMASIEQMRILYRQLLDQ